MFDDYVIMMRKSNGCATRRLQPSACGQKLWSLSHDAWCRHTHTHTQARASQSRLLGITFLRFFFSKQPNSCRIHTHKTLETIFLLPSVRPMLPELRRLFFFLSCACCHCGIRLFRHHHTGCHHTAHRFNARAHC